MSIFLFQKYVLYPTSVEKKSEYETINGEDEIEGNRKKRMIERDDEMVELKEEDIDYQRTAENDGDETQNYIRAFWKGKRRNKGSQI